MRQSSARRQPFLLVGGLALLFIVALVVVRIRGGGDRTGLAITLAALGISIVVTLAFVFGPLWRHDSDAERIAQRLGGSRAQQRLLTRWLDRARWARFVGGTAGFVFWVLGTETRGDLLVCGTLGIMAGAAAAELHHIRRQPGPRTASLEVRRVGAYLSRYDRDRMIATAAAAGVSAVISLAIARRTWAPWWALCALAVLGLAWIVQSRVASRPRPATSAELTRADDLARQLAIERGLARPAVYSALALIAHAWFSVGDGRDQWWASMFGLAVWIWAYYLWWWNRRLGLDHLLGEPHTPVLA